MEDLSVIRNFVRLTPTIATAGQPTREQYALLPAAEITAVVNLATTEHPDAIREEGAVAADLGLTYVQIPVPWQKPEPPHVQSLFRIMEALSDQPVLVHCIMNYRVSAFLFLYLRLIRALPESEARSPIFDLWEPDETWRRVLSWGPRELGMR
jgi:protein tyrosine phosphatase (PTP) superfamily phosphohydrolase (DUF442 family)